MILTIDIRNDVLTLGGFEEDELSFVSHFSTGQAKTGDELAIRFLEALSLYNIDREAIDGVVVSSVVPPLNDGVKNAIRFVFGKEALFVGPGTKSGIGIQCDIPSSVGADIIAACVATHNIYGAPALVIDMGSATIMTVINEKGAFVGTSIMPGVLMGLSALAEHTAQLPYVSLELPKNVIEKNTVDCMRSGALYGNAAMVDGMIERIGEQFGRDLALYATGTMAEKVIPLCRHSITVDEHLVLKGLSIIYKKNTKNG